MEDEGPDLLAEAAWQVYGVPPAEFVAARTAWVKRLRGEGHRELAKSVGALRKPSVSAAAVNALVRADDPVAQRLSDVGGRLRHAQSALDAAGLTTLRGERDEVLAQWVEAARTHAPGGTLTAAVEGEVRATAVAALADASATEVVLSGTLTRALAYSGFGEVDLADAVARTSTGVLLTRIEGGRVDDEAERDVGSEREPDAGSGDEADAGSGDEAGDESEVDAAGGEPETEEEPGDEAGDGPKVDGAAGDEPETDEEPARDELEVDGEPGDEPEVDEEALEQLREALAQAESEVSDARSRRRDAAGVEKRTSTGVTVAERGLEQARRLLEQAERHLADATKAQDAAAAELAEADAALAEARERRDAAREELEEAEDA